MAGRIVPEGGWRLKPFKTPRERKPSHLAFVKRLLCVACLAAGLQCQADDPAHIQGGSSLHGKEPAGGAEKSSDRWALPLCRPHHDEQHDGDEEAFWSALGVDHFLLTARSK